MNRLLTFSLLAIFPLFTMAQVNMDVNLEIGDPDYYGQIDLDDGFSPQLVYSTPIIVQSVAPYMYYPALYLRVPSEYYLNWPNYCDLYDACYYPVFFIQDYWYLQIYAPRYRHRYPHGHAGFIPRVHYIGRNNWNGVHHEEQRSQQQGGVRLEVHQNTRDTSHHEVRQSRQGGVQLEVRQNTRNVQNNDHRQSEHDNQHHAEHQSEHGGQRHEER